MRACYIVGYTYEAAVHCDPCAAARFGRCECDEQDVHGEDAEGNKVAAIFACEGGAEALHCDDCGTPVLEAA